MKNLSGVILNSSFELRTSKFVCRRLRASSLPSRRPSLAQALEMRGEVGQARQIVHGQKIVDPGKRCLDAARQRFVVGRTEERVEPDQAAAASLQTRDFIAE